MFSFRETVQAGLLTTGSGGFGGSASPYRILSPRDRRKGAGRALSGGSNIECASQKDCQS